MYRLVFYYEFLEHFVSPNVIFLLSLDFLKAPKTLHTKGHYSGAVFVHISIAFC